MKLNLFLPMMVMVLLNACTNIPTTDHASVAICSTTPTYTNDVASIINGSCAFSGCHNNNSNSAGISLEGYSNASTEFRNNSKNLASVHHDSNVKSMPRGAAKLSDAAINKLDCWVKNNCPQ